MTHLQSASKHANKLSGLAPWRRTLPRKYTRGIASSLTRPECSLDSWNYIMSECSTGAVGEKPNLWKPTDVWVAGRPNRSLQIVSISRLRPGVRRTCKKERKTSAVRSRVPVSSPAMDLEMDTARVRNDPRSTSIVDAFEKHFIEFFRDTSLKDGRQNIPESGEETDSMVGAFPLEGGS